jgi:outer membrane protein W
MRPLILATLAALSLAVPSQAQRRIDLFFDVEGVRRSEHVEFQPNTVRYVPEFENGGGVGGGLNVFLSTRVSLEVKVAALASRLQVRRSGTDFVAVADAGNAKIYPITALLQWHMLEHGAIRPYLGIGAGYVVLSNIERRVIGASAIEFDDPVGLVVDGGLMIPLSKRWSVTADARYTPIETQARARFVGVTEEAIDVRPLIVSFGLAYHF